MKGNWGEKGSSKLEKNKKNTQIKDSEQRCEFIGRRLGIVLYNTIDIFYQG